MTKSRNILRIRFRWTPATVAVLVRDYPDLPANVIAEQIGASTSCVYYKAARLRLTKSEAFNRSNYSGGIQPGSQIGINGRFKPGAVPLNKGLRRPGYSIGRGRMAQTTFKKGDRSGRAQQLYKPIGFERVSKDGYLQRKVNDDLPLQRRWKAVHVIVWEESHNRAVPRGHVVAFADGDKRNVAPSNLVLRTLRENMARNTVHNLPKPLAQLIQLRGALNRKINASTRHHEKQSGRPAQSPVRRARKAG